MGLFDKKFCDFCGNKIGLLGNKKLEDANMCKDCASKLSPWFNERRHSMKADIEKQLEYREQNKSAVAAFSTSKTIGRHTKLYVDEGARKFLVTSANDLITANPDVLDFSQALGCDLDVKESRNEIRRTDSTGKSVSYNPPRYEYSYDFHVTIRVNHPYFDEMKFSLSNGYIKTGETPMNTMAAGWNVTTSGFGLNNRVNDYYECLRIGNEIKAEIDMMRGAAPAGNMGFNPNDPTSMAMAQQQAMQQAMQNAAMGGVGAAGMAMGAMGMPMQQGMQPGMPMQQGYGMPQQGMPMQQGMQQGMPMQQGYGMPQQGMPMQQGMQQGMPMQQGYGMPQQGMPMQQGMQQGMPMQQGYGMPQQGMPMQQQGFGMPQQAAASGPVTCPNCFATTTPDASGCCEFCGTRIVG